MASAKTQHQGESSGTTYSIDYWTTNLNEGFGVLTFLGSRTFSPLVRCFRSNIACVFILSENSASKLWRTLSTWSSADTRSACSSQRYHSWHSASSTTTLQSKLRSLLTLNKGMLILHGLVLMYAHQLFLLSGTYASVDDCRIFLRRHRSQLASLPKERRRECLRAEKGVPRSHPTCNVGSPSP